MVHGPWGPLWKFVLLTTGIGAATGLTYMVYEAVRSLFEYGPYIELLTIGGIAGGVGGGLGLIMGFPAYLVVRLSVHRLHSRAAARLFFLILGAASAIAPSVIWMIVSGELIDFITSADIGLWLIILGFSAPAGILTCACSPLVVRPARAEASLKRH
ncbi:hypothetical protein [Brevibacterium oceani]|uniref:hypothetical protein n=1 Tax=Brevibacterium oceani TaxID=358099 RepID=UPI0015E7B775|nr:hypothetical protein [Brevibacterium oceani]